MSGLYPYQPRAVGHFFRVESRGNWVDGVRIMWMT